MDNTIQIADQTFISASPEIVRACFDKLDWDKLWPELQCIITQDRGSLGMRWKISGILQGTMELWFEPRLDGVLLNFFVHGVSIAPQRSTLRVINSSRGAKSFSLFSPWYAQNFRFKWDQHGVRRNARKIAYTIKIAAENQ